MKPDVPLPDRHQPPRSGKGMSGFSSQVGTDIAWKLSHER